MHQIPHRQQDHVLLEHARAHDTSVDIMDEWALQQATTCLQIGGQSGNQQRRQEYYTPQADLDNLQSIVA